MSTNSKHENLTNSGLPWHGWLLGGIFLLYGLAAAFDHIMSLTQGENFYRASGMSEMQIEYFSNVPFWAIIGWTVSVWAGLLASLVLFFRRRLSSNLFFASVIGNLVYILYVLVLSAGREAMGVLWLMPIVITVMMIGMIFYCRAVTRAGNALQN